MLNIILPRTIRSAVRNLIRSHPGFEAFCAANGIDSRDMTKENTMRAIEALGLESEVRAMVANAPIEAEPAAMPAMPAMPAGQAELADTVLSPLRPFLSPVLLDTVSAALVPIIEAALKPAIETVKTITIDESGQPIAASFTPATRNGSSTIAKLFGLNSRVKHGDKHMSTWTATDGVPAIDPFFVPDIANLARLVSAIDPALPRKPRNVWLAGPAGSGKTTLPEQVAAKAGRPFVRIAFNRATEPADLIGGTGLKAGNTGWVDGVLTRAIRRPGTIILLDEITFAPAGLAAVLQTLLDTGRLTLPTGEVVTCADGVVFVAADNTRGFGDETGIYAGTTMANAALVDRMARLIIVDYLAPDLESQALANHTGAPKAACDRVVAFTGSARKLSGFDGRPLSLRRQVAFVEQVIDGFTVAEAFDDTILSRLPDAEREAIRAHFKAAFDVAAFTSDMAGKAIPVAGHTVPAGTFDVIE
jgi:cobaltochelatase CobS